MCSRKDAPANSPPSRITLPAREPACLPAMPRDVAPVSARWMAADGLILQAGEYPPILRPPR